METPTFTKKWQFTGKRMSKQKRPEDSAVSRYWGTGKGPAEPGRSALLPSPRRGSSSERLHVQALLGACHVPSTERTSPPGLLSPHDNLLRWALLSFPRSADVGARHREVE